MSETVIKVEGLSKLYHIGAREGYRTFRETLVEAVQAPLRRLASLGKPVPEEETVWALKDVSFEVKRGEVLGIIGRNGAGKSTLLKILSRITEPTSGMAELRGRVGALLEVGTGFHPELSGRENIYLYGAILGMSSSEISSKFDAIVSFSEIGRFIDTPVKRYSSGMYMRLAFSVAAHLEPEILIVDEVLAVGDAQFQKKCLGKMGEVGMEGRTVLFVSHNLTAMRNLCTKGILLEEGAVKFAGEMGDCIDNYLAEASAKAVVNNQWDFEKAPGTDKIKIKSAYIKHHGAKLTVKIPFDIITEFWNLEDGFPVNITMFLRDMAGNLVFNIFTQILPLKKGLHRVVFHIPGELLNDGYYTVQNCFVTSARIFFNHSNANSFEVVEDRELSEWHGKWPGVVRPTFIKNEYYLLEGL